MTGLARGIRKNLKELIAVILTVALGLAIVYYIFQNQRLRIPVLEERPFELSAEFETAQAVVPGQGQKIRVAGVSIGDVEKVELHDGVGVITFGIERKYLPIYEDATILMRPTTQLKDMFFQLDPGSADAGEIEEGSVIPVQNTAPDTNLDQILAALDADSRAYLRLLITGAAGGLEDRGKELGELLGGLGPLNRDFRRLNSKLAERSDNIARSVHLLRELTGAIGSQDGDLTRLVDSSAATLAAIAGEAPDIEAALHELPGVISDGVDTFTKVSELAGVLGPTATELRPFAQNLPSLNAALTELATISTPIIADELRPFVRFAREPVQELALGAERYADALPKLTVVGRKLNEVLNTAAYNPRGAEPPGTEGRDEGYLYWAAWLGQTGTSVFAVQDAHGIQRRIYFTAGCAVLAGMVTASPLAPVVTGLGPLFEPGGVCNT